MKLGDKRTMELPSDLSLTMEINSFVIHQSKLKSRSAVYTVQELPELLRARVEPIVKFLASRGMSYFEFHLDGRPAVVDRTNLKVPLQKHFQEIDDNIEEVLELALWYVHYAHALDFARDRQRANDADWKNKKRKLQKEQTLPKRVICTWTCVVCSQQVRYDKDSCNNAECASWKHYQAVTGKQILKQVKEKEAESA